MAINEKKTELNAEYVIENIKRIKELYEAETFLDEKILKKNISKNDSFVLFDKEWLRKWKNIVGYENLKDKCKNCDINGKISQGLIDEIFSLFKENNTKEKLDELGEMDCSQFQKKIGNKVLFNEESDFVPILSHQCAYFAKSIKKQITINAQIANGVIYIHNLFPEKNKEQKLILFYKDPENGQEFRKPMITLKPNVKIQEVVKKLKTKKIDEILNQSEFKIEFVKSNEEDEKKKLEEEKKRKEEEEKKRLEKEEQERKLKEEQEKIKQKEKEEQERKEKEEQEKIKQKEKEEQERKLKEEQEKKKKKEEEKKKKEEEEKKKKEEDEKKKKEQEKKKKEEEDKKKKEEDEKKQKKENLKQEIEMRKMNQVKSIEKEKEENNKTNQERERGVNKKYIDDIQNICDAVRKQISFNEKIQQTGSKNGENFLFSCKMIKKEFLDNFEKIVNFDSINEQINKSPNDADKIFKNAINNKVKEIENIVPKKIEDLVPQSLVDIEKLAFVDDDFAAKIIQFSQNSNQNMNNQNNNINKINNNNSPLPQLPKANIIINNGACVIQTQENSNQVFTMNIENNNINKGKNIQVLKFPKEVKINFAEQIPKISGKGLIKYFQDEYTSSDRNRGTPIKPAPGPGPIIPKPRKTLDGRDCSLGLDNVGATCYMNATLQCLAHLKRITEHIINYREDGKIKDVTKYRLCEAYSEVVCEIWKKDSPKKSFAPSRFKEVLGKMNSLFAPTAANDAKDLLIYFIEQMHSELNVSSETNLNLIMPDDMNPTDHQQVLKCFVEEFMKKYNSVFSHYCYGSNVSITNCNGCGVKKYSYQCFSFIIFPLLEAKRNCVLEGRLNPMFYNNYILNIADCFQYNQKIEFFNGSNQMYCNICQGSRDSWMQTRISSPPLVLILILNRGRGNLDFREPFTFWETIDLTGYLEFPLPDNKYFLSGVVSHMGDSGPSGHFIAYCRMSEAQKWYCYNDSIVSESNFQEINSRGFPYILFYQKSQM